MLAPNPRCGLGSAASTDPLREYGRIAVRPSAAIFCRLRPVPAMTRSAVAVRSNRCSGASYLIISRPPRYQLRLGDQPVLLGRMIEQRPCRCRARLSTLRAQR
jgi:hypothetical protein